MAIVGKYSTRVIKQGTDPTGLGRWSWMRMTSKAVKGITIISAYRPCPTSKASGGETTSWMQQFEFFRRTMENPNPRQIMLDDIAVFVKEEKKLGNQVILIIDANESLRQRKQLNEFVDEVGMADCHALLQPDLDDPIACVTGTRKIDCVFVTNGIMKCAMCGGHLCFNHGVITDHRISYIDFDAEALFGGLDKEIPTFRTRVLTSKNLKKVMKYREYLWEHYERKDVMRRVKRLLKMVTQKTKKENRKEKINEWNQRIERMYNKLDTDLIEGVAWAKKKLGRFKNKAYEFSLELVEAGMKVRYWKLRAMAVHSDMDFTNQLEQVQNDIELEDTLSNDQEYIVAQKKAAWIELREVQKNHEDCRETFLEILIEHLMTTRGIDHATAQKQILTSERRNRVFQKIKSSRENMSNPLTWIQCEQPVVDENGKQIMENGKPKTKWVSVYDPIELESNLLQYGHKHFNQAAETPFGVQNQEFYDNFDGTGPIGDSIMEGTYQGKGLDEDVQGWIDSLAKDIKDIPEIDEEITEAQMEDSILKWPERTSTSPMGEDLSCLKAMCKDKDWIQLYTAMANIPMQVGFAPDLYKVSHITSIEKDPGRPALHRFRRIHIFDARFSISIRKVAAQRMMRKAEANGDLGDLQGGGRAGRRAIDSAAIKKLQYEMSAVLRKNIIILENDAKSCFDRTIVLLSNVHMRRQGTSKEFLRMWGGAYKNMKCYVKTAYGISDAFFMCAMLQIVFGTGQGNTGSMAAWTLLSVTMLGHLAQKYRGVVFAHPRIKNEETSRVGDAFVDDTGLGLTDDTEEGDTHMNLIDRMTKMGQSWECVLFGSGGRLELSKCFCVLVHWIWENGVPRRATIEETQGEIKLKSSADGEEVIIPRYECDQPYRTLGAYISGSGSNETKIVGEGEKKKTYKGQTEMLYDTLQSIEVRMKKLNIKNHEASMALQLCFMPGLKYTFPISMIDEEVLMIWTQSCTK